MAKTVVGLMSTPSEAENVVKDLTSTCRCDRADIGLMAKGSEREFQGAGREGGERGGNVAGGALTGATTGAAIGGVLGLVAGVASLSIPGLGPFIAAGPIASALAGAGIGAAAGGLIGALTNIGVPEEHAHYYAEGVRRGGTLITVHARSDDTAQCAAEVMRKHGAIDVEKRAEQWKEKGWGGKFAEGDVLPVAEEELVVGKREVGGGNVRVWSHVVERPVEQTVQLREEHVDVQRRPVDRPVSAGDDAFKERSIEVREKTEEPVVSKRSRVTEEVRVGKQATQRTEKIQDTVRHTEVEVDKGTGTRSKGTYRGPERRTSTTPYNGPERRMEYM